MNTESGEQGTVIRAATRRITACMTAEHCTTHKAYHFATQSVDHHLRKGARHALSALMAMAGELPRGHAMYHLDRAVTRLAMAVACLEIDDEQQKL